MKKIPMRTCVVSREKCEKRDLIRIVRAPEGMVEIDETGKKNGKGAYLKLELDIINKARKTKVLDRVLEVEVPENIYEQLIQLINK